MTRVSGEITLKPETLNLLDVGLKGWVVALRRTEHAEKGLKSNLPETSMGGLC